MVSHYFAYFGAHRASGSGDIRHLIYYRTSQDHLRKCSCDSMGRSPSWQVTILPFLVSFGLMQVEI